jgi:hypothetical protein
LAKSNHQGDVVINDRLEDFGFDGREGGVILVFAPREVDG